MFIPGSSQFREIVLAEQLLNLGLVTFWVPAVSGFSFCILEANTVQKDNVPLTRRR